MERHRISYRKTGRFAPMVLDHLDQDPSTAALSRYTPDKAGLLEAARARSFDMRARNILCRVIRRQYEGLVVHDAVAQSLKALEQDGTLTVTTGHQLCLFTGPLYVPLKILNVVRLARDLEAGLKSTRVVPVFWMATEDHDREEVDHVWLYDHKFTWHGPAAGAVGRCPLIDVDALVNEVCEALGPGTHAEELKRTIHVSYHSGNTLAQATRAFVNAIFGRFGVICLDADDPGLKRIFQPVMEQELEHRVVKRSTASVLESIGARYKVQAPPREINLFHLNPDARTRIVAHAEKGAMLEDEHSIGLGALLKELREQPENFSPNVLLRPVYQECILPNVAYVGGGGELAYWLQLRPLFEELSVPMPVLILRSSVAIIPFKEKRRADDLGLSIEDLFLPTAELQRKVALKVSGLRTDMVDEKRTLAEFFHRLKERARTIDHTLERSAGSAERAAMKALEHLEKRFVRAAKADATTDLERLGKVLDVMFPHGSLQERRENFMPFMARIGDRFLDELLEQLDPLEKVFTVLVEDPPDGSRDQ